MDATASDSVWERHYGQVMPDDVKPSDMVEVRCLSGATNRMKAGDVLWQHELDGRHWAYWCVEAYRVLTSPAA